MNKICKILLIVCLIFVTCIISTFIIAKYKTSCELKKSINLSMQYIKNNTLPNGRFVYKRNIIPSKKYNQKKYNILRHAGTLYSMMLCEKYLNNNSLKEQRHLASEYLIKNYIAEIKPGINAVISKPEEGNDKHILAKTGATGLALMSLPTYYKDGKISLDLTRSLGEFLIFMQNEDGSFSNAYDLTLNKKDKKAPSLYYPGEAAYGLLFLNEVDPQQKWVEASKKALINIATKETNNSNSRFDHWAMLATKKLFETENNTLTTQEKQTLQKYATKNANLLINQQITDPKHPYYGAFNSTLSLGATSTRMEGCVAIYHIIDDKDLKIKIKQILKSGTHFLANYQVKSGDCIGGIPAKATWELPDSKTSHKTIRIDNVQHALSAWITYLKM